MGLFDQGTGTITPPWSDAPRIAAAPGFGHLQAPMSATRMQREEPPIRPQVNTMQYIRILPVIAMLGLATVCPASDKWDATDPAAWSHDDIYTLMHDSPWAHAGKVTLDASRGGGMGSPGGRGGGQYPNDPNDPNGGNYPGGSRRGGIYMPGGIGLPFPGGGGGMGYPGGRGGGRGGNRRGSTSTSTAVVRWDSALPLRLAYARQDPDGHSDPAEAVGSKDEAKAPGGWRKTGDAPAAPATSERPASAIQPSSQAPAEYIIAVDGFPLTGGSDRYSRQGRNGDPSQTGDRTDSNDDRDRSQYGGRDPESIREELMERTTISRGSGRSLRPVKVEFDLPGKTGIIYFHFSREDEITLKDKELDFQTQLGGNRLERKFETKEMVYKGKLEL